MLVVIEMHMMICLCWLLLGDNLFRSVICDLDRSVRFCSRFPSWCRSPALFIGVQGDGWDWVLFQEMSRSSLADLLLSDLLQEENRALDENFLLAEGEPEEGHVDMERAAAADIGPFLTPRERKAGCKNFFWKTFTSCWALNHNLTELFIWLPCVFPNLCECTSNQTIFNGWINFVLREKAN